MNYFLKKRKWMAWLVLLTFLFTSFMPTNLLAGNSVAEAAESEPTPEQKQEEEQLLDNGRIKYLTQHGSTTLTENPKLYYDGSGKVVEAANSINDAGVYVATSKTIAPTGVENEFDITLQVETKAAVTEKIEADKKIAVVVVFDSSLSMKYRLDDDKSPDDDTQKTRLEVANEALNNFISAYRTSAKKDSNNDDSGLDKALLSIVTFDTSVRTRDMIANNKKSDVWIDLATAKDSDLFRNVDNEIDYSIDATNAGTATAGGLKKAQDLLQEKTDVKNKYIILLTDGGPNNNTGIDTNLRLGDTPKTYCLNVPVTASEATNYYYDRKDGSPTYNLPNGANGSTAGRRYAHYYANEINKSDINMYVVGLSLESAYGKINASWLKNNIAKDPNHWKSTSDMDGLNLAFGDILTKIQAAAEAYVVTDPMGEYIDFLNFKDDALKNYKSFNDTDNKIVWDLKKSSPSSGQLTIEPKTGAVSGTLTYTLSYRVWLDNTLENFTEGYFYPTNGETTLTYTVLTAKANDDGNFAIDDEGNIIFEPAGRNEIAQFRIPRVKGFLAECGGSKDIQFVKTDGDDVPLPGAQFTLKFTDEDTTNHTIQRDATSKGHSGDYANENGKQATYTGNKTGEDGVFSFSDIPSGHTYILTETETPEGYVTGGPWTVTVSYGNITITDTKNTDVTTDDETVSPNSDNKYCIVNNPTTGDIIFQKTDGTNPLAGAWFGLYTKDSQDAYIPYPDEENQKRAQSTVAQGETDAKVTFTDIPYGTYYLQELDFDGNNDGQVTIDGKTYTIDLTVYVVNVGDAVTIKNGNNVVTSIENRETMKTIQGTKTWANVAAENRGNVIVGVYADNSTEPSQTITLDGQPDLNGEYEAWRYKFVVPQYSGGEEISYTVKEISVNGQAVTNTVANSVMTGTTRTADNASTGYYLVTYSDYDITNTLVKDITVTKTWVDDGVATDRPTITVELLQNGINFKTGTIANNASTCLWTGVPVNNANGEPYIYSVRETKIDNTPVSYTGSATTAIAGGYKIVNEGLTITNTLLTDISGTKIWQNNGQTNYWPEGVTVTVKLYQTVPDEHGNTTDEPVAGQAPISLTAEKSDYTFTDLPMYRNGEMIEYKVKEIDEHGNPLEKIKIGQDTYTVTGGTKDANGQYNLVNTLSGDTDVTITKTWAIVDNDGTENDITIVNPDDITVKVTGEVEGVNEVTGESEKKVEVEKVYQITKTETGFTVTDVNTQEKLTENDYTATSVENVWTITFKNLPVANGEGKTYIYTVAETKIDGVDVDSDDKAAGYVVSVNGLNITNTPETAKLTIIKSWNDQGLDKEHSQASFTVVGKKGENTVVGPMTVTVDKDGNWTKTIDVPKYYEGAPITYKVEETNIPDGYEVSYSYQVDGSVSEDDKWTPGAEPALLTRFIALFTGEPATSMEGWQVTATNTLQTADIQLTKAYNGGLLADGISDKNDAELAVFTLAGPDESSVTLTRTGEVYSTTSGALKYGVLYTLSETAPEGYTAASDLYLKLVKGQDNGKDIYKVVKCDNEGNPLTGADELEFALNNNDIADLGTITNSVITGEFRFTKKFNSIEPEKAPAFTVYEATLSNDGYGYDIGKEVSGAVSHEGLVYTVSNLECGKYYAVVEGEVTGYEPVTFYLKVEEGTGAAAGTAVVTLVNKDTTVWSEKDGMNILTNQAKTTDLTLTKTYDGQAANLIGTGNASFKVYSDSEYKNEVISSVTVTQAGNDYTFGNLEYGKTYYVKETAPAGYYGVEFEITVTEENGVAKAEIQNVNQVNADGTRTAVSMKDNVLNNTIKTASFSFNKTYVGPQPENAATFTVTNDKNNEEVTLEVNSDAVYEMDALKYGYTYTVTENAPAGYVPVQFTVAVSTDGTLTVTQVIAENDIYEDKAAIAHDETGAYTVTNYLQQQTLSLYGEKSWLGGTTDSAITLKLFRDGVETDKTTTTSIDFNWKYRFDGLDRFDLETGKAYNYTVVEETVDGFTPVYDKFFDDNDNVVINITNVKDVEMTHIYGEKIWFDNRTNSERPKSITIGLYRNGEWLEDVTVFPDDQGKWLYDFGLWPKADPDTKIYYEYTVKEEPVLGYVSITSGYDVHNIAMSLYALGNISVTKRVDGLPEEKLPENGYKFNLYVSALKTIGDGLDEAQQRAKTLLAEAYNTAKTKLEEAAIDLDGDQNCTGKKQLFEDSVFLTNTSASAYRFFATDDNGTATLAVTTGSAIYVENVDIDLETADSHSWDGFADAVASIVKTIEDMAVEFLNAVDEENESAVKPTTTVMLDRIAQNVKVTTDSAIAFEESKLDSMFDAMVMHKRALVECENALAAVEAFKESVTTSSAIVLIVNGDMDHPIELDPASKTANEDGMIEFDVILSQDENAQDKVTKVTYDSKNKLYIIPFDLLKDETINFSLEATTGSSIQYRIEEDGTSAQISEYSLTTYIYDGQYKDLASALQDQAALEALTTKEADLTSGSAIEYVFQNTYKANSSSETGEETEENKPKPPKDPIVIPEPEVPKTEPTEEPTEEPIVEPEVPLIDVPGETIEEPEVPLGDAPKTGDSSNAVPFVCLMVLAVAGLMVTRRKFN